MSKFLAIKMPSIWANLNPCLNCSLNNLRIDSGVTLCFTLCITVTTF